MQISMSIGMINMRLLISRNKREGIYAGWCKESGYGHIRAPKSSLILFLHPQQGTAKCVVRGYLYFKQRNNKS
jgi:hypothetical protein